MERRVDNMKYFIIAFTAAIGWNVGVLVYNIIERFVYNYILKENRSKRGRVNYIDYARKR